MKLDLTPVHVDVTSCYQEAEGEAWFEKRITMRHRCVGCGTWFSDGTKYGARYCSDLCRLLGRNERRNLRRPGTWLRCVNCREWFQPPGGDEGRGRSVLYCSDKCKEQYRDERRIALAAARVANTNPAIVVVNL